MSVTKETLCRILAEFPAFDWNDQEIDELVSPRHGVISGFKELLADIRRIADIDLRETPPAGELPLQRE